MRRDVARMSITDHIDPDTYDTVRTIMGLFGIAYVLMEVVLNLNDLRDDSSNGTLLEWSKGKAIFIPFALGAIGGHLFLGTSDPAFALSNSMYPVLILAVLCGIGLFLGHKLRFARTKAFFSILLLAGLLYGHLFWSMDYLELP